MNKTNTGKYSNMTNTPQRHNKIRRGKSVMNNHVTSKALKIFSTNCAGVVYGKLDSLKSKVKSTEATVVTVQETHCRRKGRIQICFSSFKGFKMCYIFEIYSAGR